MTLARQRHRAATRFGLGVRPADPLPEDPVAAVRAELAGGLGRDPGPSGLGTGAELVRAFRATEGHELERAVLAEELAARVAHWRATPTPAVERAVGFFANHFTVSRLKGPSRGLVGAFEREAIRPHLGGRFEEMLVAVAQHPAMLRYLDQAGSVGPSSRVGAATGRGLNENLAREILELHTLGVAGGYDQGDVEAFAAILTGWTIDGDTGAFRFDPRRHEPGARTLLGRTWPDATWGSGEETGLAVLRELARHPSTARHLARKLVVHYVADDPPPADVETVAAAWRASGGHLPTVLDTVAALPSAWSAPPKVRTPHDLAVAAVVALPAAIPAHDVGVGLERLGQGLWKAPSPAGWPDRAEDWVAPDALVTRVELAIRLAKLAGPVPDARGWAERVVGPVASPELAAALPALDDRRLVALVLASPEFQRR